MQSLLQVLLLCSPTVVTEKRYEVSAKIVWKNIAELKLQQEIKPQYFLQTKILSRAFIAYTNTMPGKIFCITSMFCDLAHTLR